MEHEMLDKPEALLASPRLKRAALVLAVLLSAWLIFLIFLTLQVVFDNPAEGPPRAQYPTFKRPFLLTMSGVIAWYLISTIAAWRIYFLKSSGLIFRSRLRWTVAFSVLPFVLWIAALLIAIFIDVSIFFN